MPDRLVIPTTKITVPRLASGTIDRNDLLPNDPETGLVAVVAPAGSGKTTLLAGWAEGLARPVAWVSLDPPERAPAYFWSCVLASVGRALGPEVRLPAAGESDIIGTLIPKLINDLDRTESPLLIVLDDFHVVEGTDVEPQVAALVERSPTGLIVAVGSRIEPAMPLARWRAQRRLHEVRAAQLRFDAPAASRLLNDHLGLALSESTVRDIVEQAEGWVTGVYLLGRATAADRSTAVPDTGHPDHRHLFAYLAAETLDALDPESLSFLMATAVPDKVDPALAAALTGRADAAPALRQIAHRIAFVTASAGWYRYHQLFRETLLDRLDRDDPAKKRELHRRASSWFEERGYLSEAIDHLMAAGAVNEAADAVGRLWLKVANAGNIATVDRWLQSFPRQHLTDDPSLRLVGAWVALNLKRYDEVERLLDEAQPASSVELRDGLPADLATAAIRSHLARHRGDVATSLRYGLATLEVSPGDRTAAHAAANTVAGVAHYWAGEHELAQRLLGEAVTSGLASGEVISAVQAAVHLAASRAERGHHAAAIHAAAEADALIEEHQLDAYHLFGPAHLARGLAAVADGDSDRALDEFDAAHRLGIRANEPLDQARALLAMASLAVDAQRLGDARRLLDDASIILDVCPDPGHLGAQHAKLSRSLRELPRVDTGNAARLVEPMTPRELTVMRLLTSNLTLAEIGRELYVSVNTVKTHTKAIYRKLDAPSRRAAVATAKELGIL